MSKRLIRRKFLTAGGFGALAAGLRVCFPSQVWASTGLQGPHDTGKPLSNLVIRKETIDIDGRATTATTINGSVPGPVLEIGNTNSRYKFSIGARRFVNDWNSHGPAHHCAVGIGHISSKIDKLGKLLNMEVIKVC